MRESRVFWEKWADTLTRFKLKTLVAWLLEAGEPLLFVGAQMLYFGEPILGDERVDNLAHFLENQEETRAFAAFLRKD